MKIYINGRFLSQRVTGVQRYAREVVSALDKILQEKPTDDEWCILAPKNITPDLPLQKIKIKICGRLTGHFCEQLELPFYARNGFLLNLCNCAPLVKRNQLLIIHDAAIAAYPQAYSWKFRIWYRIMHTVCGKWADKIVTDSEFSRNELYQYFGIAKDKIQVVYGGIEHMDRIQSDDAIIDEYKLHNEKFVLAVSSQNPTKNFKLVLKAARLMPDTRFVIAGGSNKAIFAGKSTNTLKNVTYTGYVSDEKLVSLYRHAAVFVYPSLYEGFGIPPLEAMSQGCPVIVSTCASLPEVCGDYAKYCHPDDVKTLVRMIEETLSDNHEKVACEQAIRTQYSWKASAERIWEECARK